MSAQLIPSHPVSFHKIRFHPTSFHLARPHPILAVQHPAHLIPRYPRSSPPISSNFFICHSNGLHRILSCPSRAIPCHPFDLVPCHNRTIQARHIQFHLFLAHPSSSHFIPRLLPSATQPTASNLMPLNLVSTDFVQHSTHLVSGHPLLPPPDLNPISPHFTSNFLTPSHFIQSHLISCRHFAPDRSSSHTCPNINITSTLSRIFSINFRSTPPFSSRVISYIPVSLNLIPPYRFPCLPSCYASISLHSMSPAVTISYD